MKKIIIATRNEKKFEELKRLLEDTGNEFLSLNDFPYIEEIKEDGKTFEENAVKKAKEIMLKTGITAIADDSGLVVPALHGEPGIYSARYAGEPRDDKKNIEKLLERMKDLTERSAYFICVIALAEPDGDIRTFEGRVNGIITHEPKGDKGFGYDPVFIPQGMTRTFAEMEPEEKDRLSHRMMAIKLLKEHLKNMSGREER